MVYLVMIPLAINGGDQDSCKVEKLNALVMLRFRGGPPGSRKTNKKCNYILWLMFTHCLHQ